MSNIEVRRATARPARTSWLLGSTLDRIDHRTCVDVAVVEAKAEVQAAKVDALTTVTHRGLQGAAYITSVEMSLSEITPAAMTRLKAIGDAGTTGLTDIVMDTANKLRRI